MTTTGATELPVPDEAVNALVQAFLDDVAETVTDQQDHEQRVRAIAAPVVAAELRRLARTLPWSEATDPLLDRADQIAPEGTP